MNKTLIPWADFTWNPIVGCRNACGVTADNPAGYCYARRLATTRLAHLCPDCAAFTPHLHPERLGQPMKVKKPALIFADSMADWWSEGVDPGWRSRAYEAMRYAHWHRFVVLTKQPTRFTALDSLHLPPNAWLGVSITSGADWWRWEALSKLPADIHKLISVEPLLGMGTGDALESTYMEGLPAPEWVIVGPESGSRAAAPESWWQYAIRLSCEEGRIPLFEKPGLPLQPAVRQMPADLAAVYRKGGLT